MYVICDKHLFYRLVVGISICIRINCEIKVAITNDLTKGAVELCKNNRSPVQTDHNLFLSSLVFFFRNVRFHGNNQ